MHSTSRRSILSAGIQGVSVFALTGRAAFSQPAASVSVTELRGGIYNVAVGETNCVAMAGVDGALLVDGGPASRSSALLDATARLSGGNEVGTLFNTCWHPDQTGSNGLLGRTGATIIAHENTRLWLTQDVTWPWSGESVARLPEAARPNRTFYRRDSLAVDGDLIEYGHIQACPHTDGDCYVFFRDRNVLAVGDAVCGVGWPSIDWWTGGWIGGIVGGLETLLSLADDETLVVPSRGDPLRRADLDSQHAMYQVIYERLARSLYGGMGPAEAIAARPTREFDEKMGPSDQFVERAFRSLWGYLAPDA